jgi:hypothetical protein
MYMYNCVRRQLLSQSKAQNRLCFIVAPGNIHQKMLAAVILNNSEKQTGENFGEPARLCNSSFQSHYLQLFLGCFLHQHDESFTYIHGDNKFRLRISNHDYVSPKIFPRDFSWCSWLNSLKKSIVSRYDI